MFYKLFFTLQELIPDITPIINRTLEYARLVDNLDDAKIEQLKALLSLVFDEPMSENVYSIYGKYDNDGKVKDPAVYTSNIAKRMYQAIMPLFTLKQFFNNNMDWKQINALLTQSKVQQQARTRGGKSKTTQSGTNKLTNTGTNENTAENTSTANGESGHFINGEDNGTAIDYAPQYKSEGDRSKDTKTDNNKNTLTLDTQHNTTIENSSINENAEQLQGQTTEQTTNIKLDYLKQINAVVNQQRFLLTDTYYEFIYSIIIANQNLTTNPFPWVWRL